MALALATAPMLPVLAADGPTVTVWKSKYCGCCGNWIRHMQAAGFTVTVQETEDMQPVKAARGVPEALQSCHTATVGGYVLEGHVPAADVQRLLIEQPQGRGLAAAGMPQSAPGMDSPGAPEPYDIVLFGGPAGDRVFARH